MKTCLFCIQILGLTASLFDLHGPSFVSSILYKSTFMNLQLSDKASTFSTVPSYSRHEAGAYVSFRYISSSLNSQLFYLFSLSCRS